MMSSEVFGTTLSNKRRKGEGGRLAGTGPLEDHLWRVDWKVHGLPYCGVYVITTDSLAPSKIGISVNPGKRLAALQTSHWRMLQITEYRWCATVADAVRIEKEAHRILSGDDKALMGEWFDVRANQAADVVDFAGQLLGIEVRKDIPDEDVRKKLRFFTTGMLLEAYTA